jgi:transcription initiation factor TFIIH subunit 4
MCENSEVFTPAPQASSRRFSPTRLATTLTSSLPPLPTATSAGGAKDQGFIVLETNYRLYAYTGTPLSAALAAHRMS